MILGYYAIISIFFIFIATNPIFYGFHQSGNYIDLFHANSYYSGSTLITYGSGIGTYFKLLFFGIGLPDQIPGWFKVLFSAWEVMFNLFMVGFLIKMIPGE